MKTQTPGQQCQVARAALAQRDHQECGRTMAHLKRLYETEEFDLPMLRAIETLQDRLEKKMAAQAAVIRRAERKKPDAGAATPAALAEIGAWGELAGHVRNLTWTAATRNAGNGEREARTAVRDRAELLLQREMEAARRRARGAHPEPEEEAAQVVQRFFSGLTSLAELAEAQPRVATALALDAVNICRKLALHALPELMP